MAIEKRKNPEPGTSQAAAKAAELPVDYLKMVAEVFAANFDPALEVIRKMKRKPELAASGAIFPDEILLTLTLHCDGDLAATSAHASADFDPKASAPTAEQLLADCVDALGGVLGNLLDPAKPDLIERLVDEPLSALENVPFEWTAVTVNKRRVHVRVDKTNPKLDKLTDDWLRENDPEERAREERERETAEEKIVVPKRPEKSGRRRNS